MVTAMLDLKKFLGPSATSINQEIAYGATDIGKVRNSNEDYFLIDPQKHLYIVSDGMGGHNAGEVASLNATNAIDEYLTEEKLGKIYRDPSQGQALIKESIKFAHNRLYEMGNKTPAYKGMGCTVVIALFVGNVLHLAHIGDSRAYLMDETKLELLTTDHTVVMELMKKGKMTPEEARVSDLKNHLSQALGIPIAIEPDYFCKELRKGDRLLLCSDGLWNLVSDFDLFKITRSTKPHQKIIQELIHKAHTAGGSDNITCILIEPQSEPLPSSRPTGSYRRVFFYPDKKPMSD